MKKNDDLAYAGHDPYHDKLARVTSQHDVLTRAALDIIKFCRLVPSDRGADYVAQYTVETLNSALTLCPPDPLPGLLEAARDVVECPKGSAWAEYTITALRTAIRKVESRQFLGR